MITGSSGMKNTGVKDMRLVNLNCPNCSGEMEIDEEKRIAPCKYCQSRWYMEDDSLTKLSKLEKRVSSIEHRQQMQTGISVQRTTYSIMAVAG